MDYFLGIDIGTSGTKTLLIDKRGNIVVSASAEYPLYQPNNGWAEQDPEDWWRAVKSTCAQVIKKSGISGSSIKGVGLSGQMHGLVMLDENNNVIRPSIIWCDQRTAAECAELESLVGKERLFEITANPALTGFTASKILWVRKHEKENYERCRHILLPKDYIRFRLTGEYATDVSDASGMQLLDVRNRRWSEEVLKKLSIDESMLPKVFESPDITGRVTGAASLVTGIPAGTPVVGGAGDNAASAVGTGIVKDGRAFVTIGTSGVLFAHTSQMKTDPLGRVHTFCCAVPGAWHVMGVTQAAGLSLQWLRNEACYPEVVEAKNSGEDPYVIMDEQAEKVPVGSDRLIYLPYLMGERTPHLDPDCRGVFFGLSAKHKRANLIRSVMEGVAFSLKDSQMIFEEMGIRLDEIAICGGGARSRLWSRILCDVYGIPLYTLTKTDGAAFGAAILAGVGAGAYRSVEAACGEMIARNRSFEPVRENNIRYQRFYRLYRELYSNLKGSFKRLGEL